MQTVQLIRTVSPEVAREHLALISSGDMSMEESMRILFPEDAANIYDLDKNWAGHPLPD